MISLRSLALLATSLAAIVSAAPAAIQERQDWAPGQLNNTQEFYLKMLSTDGDLTYTGYYLLASHTGAGTADPIFVPTVGSRAFLNGTNLQFDVSPFAFGADGFPSIQNYARWRPVTIGSGYGSGDWVFQASAGLQIDRPEHDGWLVCEWFHGANQPQLFQLVKEWDTVPGAGPFDIPSSCARVLLFPEWI